MRTEEPRGFEFPCAYQIKAIGLDNGDFAQLVVEIIGRHCQKWRIDSQRPSRDGKYLSVSVTIEADSRTQLDAIYADLTAHERVLMRL